MADLIDEYGNPVQLTDEHGNPVRLTDEHGNPMQLTGVATSPTKTTVAVVEEVPLPGGAAVVEEVPFPGGAAAVEEVPLPGGAATVEEVPLPGGAAAGVELPAPGGVTTVPAEETTHVMSGPGTGVVSGAQLDPLVTGGIMGSAQPQDVGIGGAGGTGHHQLKDQLHRSTSSSSSEDDGQGGRRKKGIKQKLKETFGIGKHKHAQEHTPQGSGGGVNLATPAVGEAPHHEHEKKGVMEKIKEKLPGHHHTSEGK